MKNILFKLLLSSVVLLPSSPDFSQGSRIPRVEMARPEIQRTEAPRAKLPREAGAEAARRETAPGSNSKQDRTQDEKAGEDRHEAGESHSHPHVHAHHEKPDEGVEPQKDSLGDSWVGVVGGMILLIGVMTLGDWTKGRFLSIVKHFRKAE
jgi:hypothetical protein